MTFWDGRNARELRNVLHQLNEQVKIKKTFDEKKSVAIAQLEKACALISEVKAEIAGCSDEEKSKPWIAERFDSDIDLLRDNEIKFLNGIDASMKESVELLGIAETVVDIAGVIGSFSDKPFIERERLNEKKIKEMEDSTLRERLAQPSASPPPRKTSDGVSWRNVVKVARQLGGSLECKAGAHACDLVFPRAIRTIPLSSDVHCGAIAQQIRDQLSNFLPDHKIPTKQRLRDALVGGDIKLAA